MDIFDLLNLLCGLALFLFGMNTMGSSLKSSAGGRLKIFLRKMTSNPFKGFLLGLAVTAVMQSSSATTVMVVGFVNSGTMTLQQSVGVIMGANMGAAVTFWLTALPALGNGMQETSALLEWLKPSSWMPILALIGVGMLMFAKRDKKRYMGEIMLGFSVLIVGMDIMSGAVDGLKESEVFRSVLTMFTNPILGVLAGTGVTAIIQSSAASVGILQSLSTTGAITYGSAIPIMMGQNIGTCATAMLSSIGANKNGKRAALIHLYYNIISVVVCLSGFYILDYFVDFPFMEQTIGMFGIAGVHTVFKLISSVVFFPVMGWIVKLATISVPERNQNETENLLDERLMATPGLAVERAAEVAAVMAEVSSQALHRSLLLFRHYDAKEAEAIRTLENQVDGYEDALGTYLVKLSAHSMTEQDSREITKLLHTIGDFERISDHAVNIVDSAEEMADKKIMFSGDAKNELSVMCSALIEILDLACRAFTQNDLTAAAKVEPLEQVVDYLKVQIKLHHVLRLQKSECTIEHGFILSDLLTSFERVSDHCSNIAGCVLELSCHDALDMHKYLNSVKQGGEEFNEQYKEYRKKYALQ